MPRKKSNPLPVGVDVLSEDFLTYDTSILQYAERKHIAAMSKVPALPSGESAPVCLAREMLDVQVQYLNMLGAGIPSARACQALQLSPVTPVVWLEESDKDSIYFHGISIIKKMQADLLEDEVWNEALSNPKATILKMFALKARKDEYKDNASPVNNIETNIFVKVGEKDYNVGVNYKSAGGDSQDAD